MRTIPEAAEDIKSILNNIERTEECTGETLVDINELVDEILTISYIDTTEIRNKVIDEFAELMKERLKDIQFAEIQGIDVCPCSKTGEECPYINQDIGCQYCAREHTIQEVDKIAEQMKAGAGNENNS